MRLNNFQRTASIVIAIFASVGCQDFKKDCTPDKATGKTCSDESSTKDVGNDIAFDGFIQRAFEISVNSIKFADTEDFYTRFIAELIMSKPDYKEKFGTSKIEVEGEYGLERFGSNSPVFMSSMSGDGHIFQTRTDAQGKFTIKVKKSAQDETFKARVITRIGLIITTGEAKEHYCYILYGFRDGISISENTKPVIFDTYTTQLNSYQCSAVQDDTIVIPESPSGTGDTIAPIDDVSATKTATGEVTSTPHVTIAKTWKIVSPLGTNEDGTNTLVAVNHLAADEALYVFKRQVRDKDSGSIYMPVIKIAGGFDEPQATQSNLACSNDGCRKIYGFGKQSDTFIVSQMYSNYAVHFYGYDAAWSNPQDLGECIPSLSSPSACPIVMGDSGLKAIVFNDHIKQVCSLDFNAATILTGCVSEPGSNASHPAPEMTVLGGNIYSLAAATGSPTTLNVFNMGLVDQAKSYTISKLDISTEDIATGHLFSDGTNLFFASLAADTLTIRQLQLVEQ
jgi:hypothetical protein